MSRARKYHVHMDGIKRSTVLKSQQLDVDMSGYTQPAPAGKWKSPSYAGTMETLRRSSVNQHFFHPGADKAEKEARNSLGKPRRSHVSEGKREKCFLHLAGEDDSV